MSRSPAEARAERHRENRRRTAQEAKKRKKKKSSDPPPTPQAKKKADDWKHQVIILSALPSFSDIFFIILIVIPGYISIKIYRNIGGLKRIMPDKEILYSSLFLSTIIYFVLGFIFQINDYDALKNEILKPNNIPIVLITTVVVGAIFGAILYAWRRYKSLVPDDCWTSVLRDYVAIYDDPWIVVYTSDGKEYKGILGYFGIEHEPKELTIEQPYRILRDNNFNLIENVFLGDEMFFTEKDILRILFMKQKQDED